MCVTFLQNQINRKSTCNWLKTPAVTQVERKKRGGKKIRCGETRQFKGTEADAKIVAAVSNTVQAVKVVRKRSRTKIGGQQNIANSQTAMELTPIIRVKTDLKQSGRSGTPPCCRICHTHARSQQKALGEECRSLCNSAGTNKPKAK